MSLVIQTEYFWDLPSGDRLWLIEVDRERMDELKKQHTHMLGVPYYVHRHHDGKIELWPEPEK